MSVAVVVPYASTDEHRSAAAEWITARYQRLHPDWELVIARGATAGLAALAPGDPWSKGEAVAAALYATRAATLVIADADSFVAAAELEHAVDQVESGEPWAVPHLHVRRLDQPSTARVLAQTDIDERVRLDPDRPRQYEGFAGGGITVVRRDVYTQIPIDPRFVGWGGEDQAWGWALDALVGGPQRGRAVLWHLWHPHAAANLSRRYPPKAESNEVLWRYRAARRDVDEMRALVAEAAVLVAG